MADRDKDQSAHRPETLRDGMLKASIFRNEHENGAFFNTTFSKLYKDSEGELRETHSFSSDDLLRVGELAREAHNRIRELRREDREPAPERETRREGYARERQRPDREARPRGRQERD